MTRSGELPLASIKQAMSTADAEVDRSPYNGPVTAVYVSKSNGNYGECRIGSCRYGAYGKDLADTRARLQEHHRKHHPICEDATALPG